MLQRKRIFVVLLSIAMVFVVLTMRRTQEEWSSIAEYRTVLLPTDLEEYETSVSDLEERVSNLETELSDNKSKLDNLNKELEEVSAVPEISLKERNELERINSEKSSLISSYLYTRVLDYFEDDFVAMLKNRFGIDKKLNYESDDYSRFVKSGNLDYHFFGTTDTIYVTVISDKKIQKVVALDRKTLTVKSELVME